MEPFVLPSGVVVRAWTRNDAAGLLDTVDEQRSRLARWMP
jgi:hypothetical protein